MAFYVQSTQRGGNILLTWVDDNGVTRYDKITDYQPTLYTPSATGDYVELITRKHLSAIQYKTIKEANDAIYNSHGVAGAEILGNRKFELTYLKEKFGDSEDHDPDLIRGFIVDIECPAERGFPEPADAAWPINAVTIYDTVTKMYNVWGLGDYDVNENRMILEENGVDPDCVVYKKHTSEKALLMDIVSFWTKDYPAFVSGWNSTTFDIVYFINRLMNLGIPTSQLSPWKSKISIREAFDDNGRDILKIRIPGIELLDFLDLYKKHRFKNRESYKLGFIVDIEGVGTKIDYSATADDLRTLHKKDWTTYINYNICDVANVKKLDDVLGYFATTFAIAYKAGINYEQTLSPVATWENIFYKEQINNKVVLPNKKDNIKEKFEGAYVKEPIPGKYRWVCSFDLNSLYPHNIMQWNISPETLTDVFVDGLNVDDMVHRKPFKMPDGDLAVNPTGYCYRKDIVGLFPKHMMSLYSERKAIKREGLAFEQKEQDAIASGNNEDRDKYAKLAKLKDTAQLVRKILLNSLYGACGEKSFCLYDLRLARSITLAGQLAIRWVGRYVNESLNKAFGCDIDWVIYTDTDSIYVNFESVVNFFKMSDKSREEIVDFIDKFCEEKVQPMIDRGYEDMREYMNCPMQKMVMAREVISDNSVFFSKKFYAMSVWNSEGVAYEEAYIKVMGINPVVKSSTPKVVRTASKEAVRIMLNGTEEEFQNHVKKFKGEFKKFKPEDIAFPRGINGVSKYLYRPDLSQIRGLDAKKYHSYVKPVTVPIHSRAALVHNIAIMQYGIDVQPIIEGDKMKFILLKKPNILDSDVVGFSDEIPKGFKLEEKIDYNTMFEKAFHKPFRDMTEKIGWTTEKKVDLLGALFG